MSNKKYRPDPSPRRGSGQAKADGDGQDHSKGNGNSNGNGKSADPGPANGPSSPLFGEEMQARLEAAFGKADSGDEFDVSRAVHPLDEARGRQGDPFDVAQGRRAHAKASEAGKVISDAAEAELRARQRVPLSMADARRRAPGELDGWLASLSDEDLEKWMEIGRGLMEKLETRVPGVAAGSGPLTDEEARGYLANGVRLLNQVTTLTSMVLDTIDVSTLRKIAAQDSRPMSVRKALKTLGYDADRVLGTAEAGVGSLEAGGSASDGKNSDSRKRPRGRRHPLMVLIAQGASCSRLVKQIVAVTNPELFRPPKEPVAA